MSISLLPGVGFVYTCAWGCSGWGFRTEFEAIHDFKKHSCNMSI